MVIIKCKNCGQEDFHHCKGLCYHCYRKLIWRPKQITCKRCNRQMPFHAKGLCPGCYQFVFHLDKNKEWNHRKCYGLDKETYNRITKECVLCGFDKVVDLHHLDQNKKNNSETNLIGLCPNHHKMLHDFRYREEIIKQLKEKGYNTPADLKLSYK